MTIIQIKPLKKVEPKCYAYTLPEVPIKNGWIKIGGTERDVQTRIDEQTKTVDLLAQIEWIENATYENGETFWDKQFHAYLRMNGIEQIPDREWFYIEPEVSHQYFLDFRKNRGVLETTSVIPYKLRKEQESAVEQTKAYFDRHSNENPKFLWNAKPRFGKTLSSYDLCKKINANKVLIVTNRPAIATSWYDDYVQFFGTESGYYFISDVETLKGKPFVIKRENLPSTATGYIEFTSLQNLKGAIWAGGKIDKLNHIKNIKWDILIIDEAHEGIETLRTDDAFNNIDRIRTLHLSGTPFKALANNTFPQKAIYNWTYADEQRSKQNWNNSSEEENPYINLPKIALFTYKMSEIILNKVQQGADFNNDGFTENYAFDLNEFFSTNENGGFKHNDDVDKFLDALVSQEKFPFSTEKLRKELSHTFWLLNRVDSARALARKLEKHPVFKDYEIILAAGDGIVDDEISNSQSYNRVKEAIKNYEKTITLSVGQLTTGITIKEWTAVLMLSNIKSPALYMQAAFRAQNPYLKNHNGQLLRKETAYIFDFDPARVLKVYEHFANDLVAVTAAGKGDNDTRKKNIQELLNFFPVYGEDENGKMIELNPEEVLAIPRKIYAQEVVKKGFMCNFLFQNINNIFSAPKEVMDIIRTLTPQKEPVPITPNTAEELSLNDNNEVEISDAMIIGQANNVFGKKIYDITDNLKENIKTVQETFKNNDSLHDFVNKLQESVKAPTKILIEQAKNCYGDELKQSTIRKMDRALQDMAETAIQKQVSQYQINQRIIENDRKKELKTATEQEIEIINQKYDQKKLETEEEFNAEINEIINDLPKQYSETIVQIQETDKRNRAKENIEEGIRDHLRGFARTIPSFLMAYGNNETTLSNFDKIVPANVFKEVTSISLENFRFLRDGGDYTDTETGEVKHFAGDLFDADVFNDSVQEFLNIKKKLADYFDESSQEDIFDYIPPQKTNQIFTPKKVVIEMVDALQKENPSCFDEPDKTFIDLYMKSGLYIAEIVKRLYRSEEIKKQFPDKDERLKHIFANQVYGLAPTEIIYRIAIAYVLGFDENCKIEKHNLKQFDTLPAVQAGILEQELDKVFGNNPA